MSAFGAWVRREGNSQSIYRLMITQHDVTHKVISYQKHRCFIVFHIINTVRMVTLYVPDIN